MKQRIFISGILCFIFAALPVSAQNRPVNSHRVPGLGRNAIVLDINARVLDEEKIVIWEETDSKITIPGRAVGIRLANSNTIVAVQFTPFIRRAGSVLVTQGQIWTNDPERGMNYFTSIQTIPIEFGEPIHFYPLGAPGQPNSSIEIIITVNLFNEIETENITNNDEN